MELGCKEGLIPACNQLQFLNHKIALKQIFPITSLSYAKRLLCSSLYFLSKSVTILQSGSDKFPMSFNKLFEVKYNCSFVKFIFLELFFCSINYRVRVPLI